jgi:hypothetical protein
MVASDIPDFRRLSDEEGIAIDFFAAGDVKALAEHLADLLGNRERQVEMALQNVSAALRMSMPEIIREYLRTFELRQGIEAMRSISRLRKLPRWFPMRDRLVKRKTSVLRRATLNDSASTAPTLATREPAEVVYMSDASQRDTSRTGTDGM